MPDDDLLPAVELPMDSMSEQLLGPRVVVAEDEPDPANTNPFDDIESKFDPRYREDFVGLLYLGKLEEECTVAGHRFLLITPSHSERMEMGPLHKPYVNTLSAERAWESIVVASYLREIDGTPKPLPLRGDVLPLRESWEWVKTNIYSPQIISEIFEKCLLLDDRTRTLIGELDDLGKVSA